MTLARPPSRIRQLLLGVLLVAVVSGIAWAVASMTNGGTRLSATVLTGKPDRWLHPARPTHVVVVVEENKSAESIIGSPDAPYINRLARTGALFTHASGVAHPSQPNYLALLTGTTNSDGDDCPQETVPASTPTLAGGLRASGFSFGGYSESMPTVGYAACTVPDQPHGYARKHNPWVNFDDVPKAENLPLASLPSSYDRLPTVSFIVPDLAHDMHDGTIAEGDEWLRGHVGPIVDWAQKHGALVVVTWDESEDRYSNHIPTIFVGQGVKPGRYDEAIDHYSVLRTIEELYGLKPLGRSSTAAPITDCWLRVPN